MNHITNDCLSVEELQCNTSLFPSLCQCRDNANPMGEYFIIWCISCFKKSDFTFMCSKQNINNYKH